MSKKLKTFLTWVGAKKGRWKVVLFSTVVLLLTLGFILFMLLSGFDKEKGLYKTPIKVDVKVKKGGTK
jgi:hypothetical protein